MGGRILECAGTTALWNDATCRVGGKRRPVAAVHMLAFARLAPLPWAVMIHGFLRYLKLLKLPEIPETSVKTLGT